MSQAPLKHMPHMWEFQSKLAMLALGAALIAFATCFSIYVHFEPIVISGDEWTFGPREVAHLIGFMGCVLTLWFCGNSFATRSTMLVSLSMLAIGIGLVVIAIFAPREIKDLFNTKAVEASLWVLLYYLMGCGVAWHIQKSSQWIFQPRRMLSIAAIFLALISIGWEVCTQPFEHVYQKPPRGYVQFAQVLCDFVGIAVGFALVNSTIRRLETRCGGNSTTPDCANTMAFLMELKRLMTMLLNRFRQRMSRTTHNV